MNSFQNKKLEIDKYCQQQYHLDSWIVLWGKSVEKDLDRIPLFIQEKFRAWVVVVEREGMPTARKLKGFHDEPLLGSRKGQRSIRLNKAYRVIYEETKDGKVNVVRVTEVNKHEY